jgi:KaiC/GvpD/RAD55 family RecA-like ATPase
MIIGDSGSGKSVLMQSLAYQSLKSGRGCIYVTNVEVPSNVRTTAIMLGMDLTEYESEGKLIFIDCYSSLSGTASKEKRSLASITDLTGLGILITRSIEEIGSTTDVYLDALTPLFTSLKTDYVLTFIESIGAKVKSYDGGLCTILGKSAEKETITRVEEVSDCVIETQLSESRTGQRRRLRVKKLRGHPYEDTWTRFTITNEGITFYTRKSPPT